MKKRKELNALIGLGDSGKRKKAKKGSGHRLLRTEPPDSESPSSSDDDGFGGLGGSGGFGKRSYAQCCNVCYPLFLFIILAACVMACAGLIWMQIALKEDLDSLKEKLHSMETSQKALSSEIPKLSEDLKNKQRRLDELESGSAGLDKLWANLTEMNLKIGVLDSAVNHLKANLKSAADLVGLPTTVEELQKSVATIGSTLTSVQHDVHTMQEAVQGQRRDQDRKSATDVTDLRKALSDANRTEEQHHTWTDEQIHILLSTVADLHHRVASLENGSRPAEVAAAPNGGGGGRGGGGDAPVATIEKDATTAKPSTEDAAEISLPAAPPLTSRRPRFLSPTRVRRLSGSGCPERLQLPGVTSFRDLEELFRQAAPGPDSAGLTQQDLGRVLGALAPGDRTFGCFDRDGDRQLTLSELQAATGL
ncbi:unnamed protein product [Ophioblennius macclurei]